MNKAMITRVATCLALAAALVLIPGGTTVADPVDGPMEVSVIAPNDTESLSFFGVYEFWARNNSSTETITVHVNCTIEYANGVTQRIYRDRYTFGPNEGTIVSISYLPDRRAGVGTATYRIEAMGRIKGQGGPPLRADDSDTTEMVP